jgi:hypothetical protein
LAVPPKKQTWALGAAPLAVLRPERHREQKKETIAMSFHPTDRYIYVISGTWWVGTDAKYDPDNIVPVPAGSYVTHFGKQIHYDGAKDEEFVLEIVGMGPATSTPAEAK